MVGATDAGRLAADLVGPVATVEREGAGWDHVAWRVTGADGVAWIVKVAIEGEPAELAPLVRREVGVMRLARDVLGDVVADAVVLDADRAVSAYRRLSGVSLQSLVVTGAIVAVDLGRLARRIGGVISAVAAIAPPTDVATDAGFAPWYEGLPESVAAIDDLVTVAERAAIRRFVRTAPPSDPDPNTLPLTHNDLGAEHVLVDPVTLAITGIIDWTDAARADPAAEVGRLLRDLGAERLDAVLDGLGATGAEREVVVERAWCYARCLVLEDLAYARRHRPDLVAFERASLAALFAGEI